MIMLCDNKIIELYELSWNMIGWIGCAFEWWLSGQGFKSWLLQFNSLFAKIGYDMNMKRWKEP